MNLFQRLRFNFWYFGSPPWDTGVSPPELFEFIDTHPRGRAIDLGCGTGTNVITLAKAGWSVTGVDFASRAIALARRKTRAAHIQAKLRVGDATRLDGIEGPFDLALDMGCFHNIGDRAAYLRELDRLLAPGGFWLMYGFVQAPASLDGPGTSFGLGEADLELIHQHLTPVHRRDGSDRGSHPSAWFLYQKNSR
ncbi:MAG: class I SAM-dependent methyltransferase [Chloroflexi bacterium]|nr:class I SAM-dependent methyltransferase [Chloroflexota bacterium]